MRSQAVVGSKLEVQCEISEFCYGVVGHQRESSFDTSSCRVVKAAVSRCKGDHMKHRAIEDVR